MDDHCPNCKVALKSNAITILSSWCVIWFFLISPIVISLFSQYGIIISVVINVLIAFLLLLIFMKVFFKINPRNNVPT